MKDRQIDAHFEIDRVRCIDVRCKIIRQEKPISKGNKNEIRVKSIDLRKEKWKERPYLFLLIMYNVAIYILGRDLLNSALLTRRKRPPFRLLSKLANLPKVSIRDLAHAGNWTPAAEITSHIDKH